MLLRIAARIDAKSRPAIFGSQICDGCDGQGLVQFARSLAITAHDYFVTRRQNQAFKQASHLQRQRVGPSSVIIRRIQQQGPIGQNPIQHIACHGLVFAQHHIVQLIAQNQPLAGMTFVISPHSFFKRCVARHTVNIEQSQRHGTTKDMHVGICETRQDRGTFGINHAGFTTLQGCDIAAATKFHNAPL